MAFRPGAQIVHHVIELPLAGRGLGFSPVKIQDGEDNPATMSVSLLPLRAPDGSARVLLLGRETTVERGIISALVESRRLFRDLVMCSSDFAWETNEQGAFGFVSPRGALGYSVAELNGRLAYDMLDRAVTEPEIFPFDTRVQLEDAEVHLLTSEGASACLLVSCIPVFSTGGDYKGARGVCRDVTGRPGPGRRIGTGAATLLANPNAQIREDTLDQIIEVAEQAEPLHEPLVSRPELSQGAIRRIAGFVSAAILEILNHEHAMDDETKQYVNEAVKKRIKLEQAAPAQGSLKEKIERMADSDELTEDAITGAGEKGQRGFVAEALAFRAKIEVGTVNAMLDSRSGKAVTALSWRAKSRRAGP